MGFQHSVLLLIVIITFRSTQMISHPADWDTTRWVFSSYLFKWRRLSHVIQHYTSVWGTACKKLSLWRRNQKQRRFKGVFLIGQSLIDCLTSTGLKWTELKLSTPQVKERMGLLLCSSQMSTCWPQVANKPSSWWWSRPVNTVCMGTKFIFQRQNVIHTSE